MHPERASSTASLVAQGLLLAAADARTAHLVQPEAVRLTRAFLRTSRAGRRALRGSGSRWFRAAVRAAERATVPGLAVHYALRKRAVEGHVRAALAGGAQGLVVLGAGGDTLAVRLHREHPGLPFVEVDRAATQRAKREALAQEGLASNLRFAAHDLRGLGEPAVLRAALPELAGRPVVVVAEAVLMYLQPDAVRGLLRSLRAALVPGSTLVFTFMGTDGRGRPSFRRQTALARGWLRLRREPFLWGMEPAEAAAFLEPLGFRLAGVADPSDGAPPGVESAAGEHVAAARPAGEVLDDVQTRLNATWVRDVARPTSTAEVQAAVRRAAASGLRVSVSGGRHAQGGQAFADGALHLDLSRMARVLGLDAERGILHAQAGIQWPALLAELRAMQERSKAPWGIVQKQTGANDLSLGGALAANVHGRGLARKPIVGDVEAFLLVGPDGEARRCSREENADLFRLAVGGYGLFGVITEVWLRLRRRVTLERVVEVIDVADLPRRFGERIADGFEYGDFQYAIDPASPDFLRRGVFSSYRPKPVRRLEPPRVTLSQEDWDRLVRLAHTDPAQAFQSYADHYLATDGQVYDSDLHQLANYLDDYHQRFDAAHGGTPACEVITELFVERGRLVAFLDDLRAYLREQKAQVIYGTVRLVEQDGETALAWARKPWACTIVNLHVEHTPAGLDAARRQFRGMNGIALRHGGSFYLTYHRFATREQLEQAHPRLREVLEAKRRVDPDGRFDSAWHRHVRDLLEPPR